MSGNRLRTRNHLLLLDIALLLLGGLLIVLVLRLLRFDSPDLLTNAWTYTLGVPTVLIAVAMLTHTLSNDVVERSIQVGFLCSVIVHLLITWGAANWVLFGGFGNLLSERGDLPADEQERTVAPVYFQPAPNLTTAEVPDYMRPIPTDSLSHPTAAEETAAMTEIKESSGASKLDIDVAPELILDSDKQIILPPKTEFETNEPVIESSQAEPVRPDVDASLPDQNTLPGSTVLEIPSTSTQANTEETHSAPPVQNPQSLDIERPVANPDTRTLSSLATPSLPAQTLPTPTELESRPYIVTPQSNLALTTGSSLTLPPQQDMTADSRLSADELSDATASRHSTQTSNELAQQIAQQVVPIDQGADAPQQSAEPTLDQISPDSLGVASPISERAITSGASGLEVLSPSEMPSPMNSAERTPSAAPLKSSMATNIDSLARSGRRSEIELPDLGKFDTEPLRFMRPDALGAPGILSSVPLPAPAFSQRIERIKERDKQATDSLGVLGPKTELAIELGLQFLANHQRPDGSWSLSDYPEPVRMQSTTAATGLALLSFQGAGYTHKQFKYEQTCRKAIEALVQSQRPNGDLYQRGDSVSDANAWLYSHAIATLALCEAYGMTQDAEIKHNAQLAIDFLVASQDPSGGGWRYTPRIGSDTSVSGWVMMALKSAELSGLEVEPQVYEGIERWLNNSQAKDAPYLYRYNWQANTPTTMHGRVPTPVMTSVGLLMRLYTGWKRDHPQMKLGTEWLMQYLPSNGTIQSPARDTYYWYYATQVMFHEGGERWDRWYNKLYPLLIDSQEMEGDWVGSWHPGGDIPDAWGEYGGRLYVTTLNLLSLEIYYRHLPLYDATAE